MVVAVPAASAKKKEKVEVCKHGCDYRTIQDAVDATGKNAVINVHPGKYKEGVRIVGKKHNGLTIQGTGKNPKKVILEGKNAKDPEGQPANNGIEADGVNGVRVLNLWARNYLANGIFIHGDSVSGKACNGYLMKNLRVSFNRAYGLFAFNCIGGRMTKSVGYGHGDSAFYVGETPAADEAEVDEARPPRRLRERARLLGHELQVREDHASRTSTTTAPAWSRTRSTRSASSRPRPGSSRTTTSSGTTSTTSCPTRA